MRNILGINFPEKHAKVYLKQQTHKKINELKSFN
jgi:hypothetical protein